MRSQRSRRMKEDCCLLEFLSARLLWYKKSLPVERSDCYFNVLHGSEEVQFTTPDTVKKLKQCSLLIQVSFRYEMSCLTLESFVYVCCTSVVVTWKWK